MALDEDQPSMNWTVRWGDEENGGASIGDFPFTKWYLAKGERGMYIWDANMCMGGAMKGKSFVVARYCER